MSIREIIPKLDVTGKGLARELALPLDTPKKKPLNELGISQEQLDHATTHILSHRSTRRKYYLFAAIVLFGFVYLTRFGRPDNANISERKLWYPRIPYIISLLVAVLVCGFVLGKSPNPMEGTVKVFKSMVGLYPSMISKLLALVFFVALAIIGNKLICGWACPFGALQELVYSLPILRKMKRWKAPFWLTNTIRGGLFFGHKGVCDLPLSQPVQSVQSGFRPLADSCHSCCVSNSIVFYIPPVLLSHLPFWFCFVDCRTDQLNEG
ncbi:MAG: 4Fe-4S binding protein [Planctomycetota bacterium]|jgi:hypothetical protein